MTSTIESCINQIKTGQIHYIFLLILEFSPSKSQTRFVTLYHALPAPQVSPRKGVVPFFSSMMPKEIRRSICRKIEKMLEGAAAVHVRGSDRKSAKHASASVATLVQRVNDFSPPTRQNGNEFGTSSRPASTGSLSRWTLCLPSGYSYSRHTLSLSFHLPVSALFLRKQLRAQSSLSLSLPVSLPISISLSLCFSLFFTRSHLE